jgi:hypothetical protein
MLATSFRIPLFAVMLGALAATPSAGQQAPRADAEVRGVVVLAADLTPVSGARISLESSGHVLLTDAQGRFRFPKVPAGAYLVRAEVTGFQDVTSSVTLVRGERVELEVQIGESGAVELPEIAVEADGPPPISPNVEFSRRVLTGRGRYITRDMIERRNAATLMDLFRSVPGMRIVCPRTERQCFLRVARASSTCGPAYFLDGVPADPTVLFMMSPLDTEGIEIYSGPSGTPPEFERGSACGTVVIWTRMGRRNAPSNPPVDGGTRRGAPRGRPPAGG